MSLSAHRLASRPRLVSFNRRSPARPLPDPPDAGTERWGRAPGDRRSRSSAARQWHGLLRAQGGPSLADYVRGTGGTSGRPGRRLPRAQVLMFDYLPGSGGAGPDASLVEPEGWEDDRHD